MTAFTAILCCARARTSNMPKHTLSLSPQSGIPRAPYSIFLDPYCYMRTFEMSCALCCGHNPPEEQVMSLDFHPVHNSLLAVGCHDGTVMVFDVRHKANRPIYSSSIKTGKHTDPVWQVCRRARRHVQTSGAICTVGKHEQWPHPILSRLARRAGMNSSHTRRLQCTHCVVASIKICTTLRKRDFLFSTRNESRYMRCHRRWDRRLALL